MKHFIYKTIHPNGKYYIGRHSTTNLKDGYIGSGKWVSQIKKKDKLVREIIEFVDSFEELIIKEDEYLAEHYGKPNCMNMSNKSTGAATGLANPMTRDEVKSKFQGDNHWSHKNPEMFAEKLAGDNHWMNKDPERKEDFIKNNPNLDGRNAKIAMKNGKHNSITNNPSTINALNGTHHWQNGKAPNYEGKLNKKLIEEGRHNFLGPDTNQKRIDEGTHNFVGSAANIKMLAEGKHPSQRKMTCSCGKTVSSSMYKRWHGDNCKMKVIKMNARQYEKMRNEQLRETMEKAGIKDYTNVCLSADQQEYEVTLKDGTEVTIPSGLPYHYD
jgi:molybdopterin converting factor small subunit